MKVKVILAVVIVIAVGAWAFTSFTGSMTTYVSLAEAQKRGARVQVMGEIDHDRVVYDVDQQLLTFPITDEDGTQATVRYAGTMPGNFSQASHAVCKGQYEQGEFVAEQLLVKCPSKYQGEEI